MVEVEVEVEVAEVAEPLLRVPAPVLPVPLARHSWLDNHMDEPHQPNINRERDSTKSAPGNNPDLEPPAPTPDHHASSTCSICSINSPSMSGSSLSSSACAVSPINRLYDCGSTNMRD